MMKLSTRSAGAISLILAACLQQSPVMAQQLSWHDGNTRHPLWIDPALIADFSGPGSASDQVLRPAAQAVTKSVGSSPVFRDAPDAQAPARALPGGVIVRVSPSLDPALRQAVFTRHGLNEVRELGTASGIWLIATSPGLPALELANRLHESGDFISASPNWWRPRAPKSRAAPHR